LSNGLSLSSVTNQPINAAPEWISSTLNTKLFPDITSKVILKTDCNEVDAVLEKMKNGDNEQLRQELIDALRQVSSRALDERKSQLKAVDIATFNKLEEAHKSALFLRQLYAEEEQQSDAVSDYNESLKNLITVGRGTGLKYIQRVLLKWYEPLTRVLDAEVSLIEQRVVGQDRTVSDTSVVVDTRNIIKLLYLLREFVDKLQNPIPTVLLDLKIK
jgi:hypothetical protein